MHNAESRKLSYKIANGVIMFIMILLMLITIYPLYYTICASFSDARALLRNNDLLLKPLEPFTLDGYKAVFADPNIVTGYGNSVLYTVLGTIYSVALIYMTAYPLSEADLPGRKLIAIYFLITMYFGGGLIPSYLTVKNTGLIGTVWAMFVPGGLAASHMIIARNYFENSIPASIKEAAEIDGASKLTVFFKIIIPLSRPIMAVMVVFSMVAYWNEWFTALIYLKGSQAPLPLVLRNILIKSSASAAQASTISGGYAELNKMTEMIKFASIIVAAAPMLIIYPFVQKYFEQGFMTGAVKG